MREIFWKVRDKKTGLFREGGMFGGWSKFGKAWTSIGHVKNHFNQFPADKIDWENWELVEFAYILPVEVGSTILKELIK